MCCVDAVLDQAFEQGAPEFVVADAPDHVYFALAKARHGHCLVCAFAPGNSQQVTSQHCFTRPRKPGRADNKVHVDRTNNNNRSCCRHGVLLQSSGFKLDDFHRALLRRLADGFAV